MCLLAIDIGLAAVLSAFIAIMGYAFQAWLAQKKEHETMRRRGKEKRYIKMLKALHGFYESTNKDDLKQKFIEEYRISWLYASDDVIKSIDNFFDMIKVGAENVSQEEKKKALGQIVINMRKDLRIETKLRPSDFETWVST